MRRHAGPTALFATLAVAWTWPLVLHLGDAVPGDPGDNYSFLWNLWWMRHVLATPGLAYFDTTYLFYPFGTTIANHPHTALPALVAATLLGHVSIVTAQNLLLIAYVFANMTAMYALVWSTTMDAEAAGNRVSSQEGLRDVPSPDSFGDVQGRRRRAAIFAGIMFGLSPYVAAHLLGHFDLVAAWVLPAFALALGVALRRGSNRASFAAGAVLAATAYIAYYYVVYQWLFTIAYATAWAARMTTAGRRTAASVATRRLRWMFLSGAAVSAVVAIEIAATGGGAFALGPFAVSAREPQHALTALWICAIGWIATVWRPIVRVSEASAGAGRRAVAVVCRIAIAFVVGAAPLLWQDARLIVNGRYVTPYYGWNSAPRGIDLSAPFAGHPWHPLLHTVSQRAYAGIRADPIEAVAWIGVIPFLLLAAMLARGVDDPRREMGVWRTVAIVFLLWSLGPYLLIGGFDTGLKLPELVARFVPFAANARMPGRGIVGAYMALALLIAMALSGTSRLPARLCTPAVQWIAIALLAFEYWDAPIRLTTLDRPAVYATLAAAPPGAVCEVPFGMGDGLRPGVGSQDRRVLFYATVHEHPLVGGYIGRMPTDAVDRYAKTSIASALLQLSDGQPLSPPDADAATRPCRYIVVHRAATSAALLTYIRQLPIERIAEDGARDLYEFR